MGGFKVALYDLRVVLHSLGMLTIRCAYPAGLGIGSFAIFDLFRRSRTSLVGFTAALALVAAAVCVGISLLLGIWMIFIYPGWLRELLLALSPAICFAAASFGSCFYGFNALHRRRKTDIVLFSMALTSAAMIFWSGHPFFR